MEVLTACGTLVWRFRTGAGAKTVSRFHTPSYRRPTANLYKKLEIEAQSGVLFGQMVLVAPRS